MKTKFKYTKKELIEIGEFILTNKNSDPKKLSIDVINKLAEIQESKLIELSYLKVSQVKMMSKNKVDLINENATHRLLNLVFKKTLTPSDFQKIKISSGDDGKSKLVYSDNKFIGEFMQVKEGGYFKLLFRFE